VYLESRNHLDFVRVHWHRYLFVAILLGCVDVITYLFALSPKNFKAAVDGLLAGMKAKQACQSSTTEQGVASTVCHRMMT
jgi:N-acetylglucosaminyl-diphospho-decaprenol L-rhamnosyltransferase